ncbi:V-type proton ATPase subunit G-like [Iris pallida]|uniref:V-type proton ATPase subunit G-like n=1 Tax=Iris pallida TaxID=29817 RepID=A0AAX6H8D0_IRIPA|nr:V-type proton ATPase subunit G-like [Iris pallida]
MARLKQAKDEAEMEAVAYRDSLEEKYRRKISDSSGSSGSNVKRLDEETEIKVQKLKDATKSVRPEVVSLLMKHITTVRT